jgi:hypothetical protein
VKILQHYSCDEANSRGMEKIGHVPRKYSDKIWLNLKRFVTNI